jgi:hypothetical protein
VNDVHHCPFCELRFVSRNEVEDHVALDHPRRIDDDTVRPRDQGARSS